VLGVLIALCARWANEDATASVIDASAHGDLAYRRLGRLARGSAPLVAIALVNHAAMHFATLTTVRLGDLRFRTTNATPYPPHVPEREVCVTKKSYASAQMLATSILLSGEPSLGFLPALPIQLAAFGMTLVRKNVLSEIAVHKLYAWALLMNNLAVLAYVHAQPTAVGWRPVVSTLVAWRVALPLRWHRGWGKHAAWLVAAPCGWGAPHLLDALAALVPGLGVSDTAGLGHVLEVGAPGLGAGSSPWDGLARRLCLMAMAGASLRFLTASPNVLFGPIAGGKGEGRGGAASASHAESFDEAVAGDHLKAHAA
jgi:hypothetical protein